MFLEENKFEEGKFDNFFVQAIDGYYDQKPNKLISVNSAKPWKAFSKKYNSRLNVDETKNNFHECLISTSNLNEDELNDEAMFKKLDFNFDCDDTNIDSSTNSFSENEYFSNGESLSIKGLNAYGSRNSFNEESSSFQTTLSSTFSPNNKKPKFTSLLNKDNLNNNELKEEIKNYKLKREAFYSFNLKKTLAVQLLTQMQLTKKMQEALLKKKL